MPSIAGKWLRNMPWSDALQAILMLLMMQAQILGVASPLAVAWLCAGLGGSGAWVRWAGMAAGALLCGGEGWWILPLMAAMLIGIWEKFSLRTAEGTLLAAGCLTIVDAAARSGGNPASAQVWLMCGIISAICTLVMQARLPKMAVNVGLAENAGALQAPAREKRQPMKFPAKTGAMAVAVGASVGAAAFGGETGVLVAAALLVQWPDADADMLGLLLCAALGLSGVPLQNAAAMIVLLFALRLLERWGRPAQLLGSLAASGAWLLAGGSVQALGYLAALAPAAGSVYFAAPRRTMAQRAHDEQLQFNRLRKRTGDQLTALADVVSMLAQGHASGLDPPREDEVLLSLRARLCDGCVRYERCWNGRAGEGLRLLCELITRSVNGTLPEQVLPDMMRRCMRANIIPTRLYAELNRFSQTRGAHIARMDGAHRARLTIDTASEVLRAAAQARGDDISPTMLRWTEAALRCEGISGACLTLSPDGLVLTRSEDWTRGTIERAQKICTKRLGARYICAYCDGRALGLRPAPALVARTGWDGMAVSGGRSGDSVYIGALDDRRQLVLISDGMGTGADAAGESRRAIDAVKRLLRAGIPPERAALLTNQLLISEGSAEMFATLDLCVIDNWKMEAVWVKMAACDSYLLREHDCSVIPGGYLPMGILAEATPQVVRHDLQPGDVIVMGTDGAMEGLDPDTAQRCLIPRRDVDARRLARCMRMAGQEKCAHADDQTLAVIRMERARDISAQNDGNRDDVRRDRAV